MPRNNPKNTKRIRKSPTRYIKVEGESCWPYLVSGNVYRVARNVKPKIGDFVVARTQDGIVVKKLSQDNKLTSTVSWGSSYNYFSKDVVGVIHF